MNFSFARNISSLITTIINGLFSLLKKALSRTNSKGVLDMETRMEIRAVNREYRRCKRNYAFYLQMKRRRKKMKQAKLAKELRKANRDYRHSKRAYYKKLRTERRIYRGKVIWCKRHGESIDACCLSDSELESLGTPLFYKICFVLVLPFWFISLPIQMLFCLLFVDW